MIHIFPSAEDIDIFKNERINHPIPGVQKRMDVLWLKHNGLPRKEIAKIADVSVNTATDCLRMYNTGGAGKLREVNFYRPQSEPAEFGSSVEDYFKRHPPASVKEAADKIEKITGLRRSGTRIRKFLKETPGFRRRKIASVPAGAGLQEQERFKKESPGPGPGPGEAGEGKRKVFSADAAHFVSAPFSGFLWSPTRIFIKAPAGGKRFNVSGAPDAVSHKLYMVTSDTCINAESVCNLLAEIAGDNVGVPITSVLDNARYQKCKTVWESARNLNTELLYIPPYPPNLNLIERLWKFLKKKCLYSKYYSDFSDFRNAISDCLKNTHTIYKEELDSLLRLNFQTFKESQFVPA